MNIVLTAQDLRSVGFIHDQIAAINALAVEFGNGPNQRKLIKSGVLHWTIVKPFLSASPV